MGETETEVRHECATCEDSGKVLLNLTGAQGGFTKELPCPNCKAGVTLETGVPTADMLREEMRENYRNLALLLGAVAALAALAFVTRNGRPKSPDVFTKVLGEGADNG